MEIKRLDENGKVTQEFYEYALQCCKDNIEIWADVEGYEGMYQVSNFGRVKSLSRVIKRSNGDFICDERILKASIKSHYYFVGLYKERNGKMQYIHILESKAFIPNPNNKPQINHKDTIKTNVLLSNLEWNTVSENSIHAYKNGLINPPMKGMFGKNHNTSKPVFQYSIDGTYINKFYGTIEAERMTGVGRGSIYNCFIGKNKTSGGFKWSRELII